MHTPYSRVIGNFANIAFADTRTYVLKTYVCTPRFLVVVPYIESYRIKYIKISDKFINFNL